MTQMDHQAGACGVAPNTRGRILDASERLFAQHGFESATMRAIASEADESLGTLTYHFPSKTELLIAVIKRRLDDLAEARRAAYESALANPGRKSAIEITVHAIVAPYVERSLAGPSQWRHYTRLLARVLASGNAQYYHTVLEIVSPYASEYQLWLRNAVAEASAESIGYAYQFMIGSMLDCSTQYDLGRFHTIKPGKQPSPAAIMEQLVRYITAGVAAIIAPGD